MRSLLMWSLTLLLLATPGRLLAASTDAAAAEALFQRGRTNMELGELDEACQLFEESFALDPAVGTVMNLATCEEQRGHLAASWERWHQALDLLPEDDDRVGFARKQLDSIEGRIAYLTIIPARGAGKNITVERDGVELGRTSFGQPLPIDPGEHLVTVRSETHEAQTYTIVLEPGQTEELTVKPGPEKPRAAKKSRSAPARRAVGISALAVGGAGAITAIVTGVMLPAQDKKVRENCPGKVCNQVGDDARDTVGTLLAVNMAGWITAGVGLVTGGVLLLTLPKKSSSKGTETSSNFVHDEHPIEHHTAPSLELSWKGSELTLKGAF